jgi:hypothetical protein
VSGSMAAGFVYVSDDTSGPMAHVTVGKRVATGSLEPPWIVVDHSLERIIVARWPGRLFRVAIVPPRTDEEKAAMRRAASELQPTAGYTRALAVDMLEELPPSILFGPHGGAVVDVINVSRFLTEDTAARLASARHPTAADAYRRAWAQWLSADQERPVSEDHDVAGTLAAHASGRSGSPIGAGLMVAYRAVTDSARLRGKADAITIDDEGDELISEPWSTAMAALLDAAMAVGAPDLVGDDAAVLTAAWRAVIGDDAASAGA